MKTYGLLVDAFVIFAGFYCLYIRYRQRDGKTFVEDSKLLQTGATKKNCKDVEGYIRDSNPKTLIVGLLFIVYGILDAVIALTGFLGYQVQLILITIFVVFLIVLAVWVKKLNKKYWPDL